MPDQTEILEDPPLGAVEDPPVVTDTVTVTSEVPAPSEGEDSPEPLTATLDEETNDGFRSLVEDLNALNTQLEGGASEAGPLLLDADQFGALGVGLALVVALLAALLVVNMRR